MVAIKEIVKQALPEGVIKDSITAAYRAARRAVFAVQDTLTPMRGDDFDLRYDILEKKHVLDFKTGDLEGTRMVFPTTDPSYIRCIPNELPAYLEVQPTTHNAIVIDAGSFPGEYTTALNRMQGVSAIICLEPNPVNMAYLASALKANGVNGKARLLPYALSESNGSMEMRLDGVGSSLLLGGEERRAERQYATVPTMRLDDLLHEQGALSDGREVIVKMDIEGAEVGVIAAARDTLTHGARFAIAAYHVVDGEQSYKPLESMLRHAGYDVRLTNPKHLTLIAEPR